MQVRSVYADRGFGTGTADQALARQRIRDPVIPRQQQPAAVEHTHAWKRRYRYRNGIEGRISQLKPKGLARTRLRKARAPGRAASHSHTPPTHGNPELRSITPQPQEQKNIDRRQQTRTVNRFSGPSS
jgi:hypothetical protein